MQVLSYQSAPIAYEKIQQPIIVQKIESIQQQMKQPVNQLFNNTLETINETIQQVVDKVEAQKSFGNVSEPHDFEEDWNFLYFLRLFFYLLVILKIVELIFSKRKKIDIKERVYRKFVFSHAEMIREFNDDDRKMMDMTLKNTIKNASMQKNHPKMVKKTSSKKVIFHQTKNEYYQPKKITENQNCANFQPLLQMFQSQTIKVEPMQRQVEQEPQDQEFQIIETIMESKQVDESGIFFEKEYTESNLTGSTLEGSRLQQQSSQISQNNEATGTNETEQNNA